MITTLLFDLGNVLLYFDHGLIAEGLSRHSPRGSDAIQDPAVAELLVRYERGAIPSADFYRDMIRILRIDPAALGYDRFSRIWSDIFTPNRELLDLLPGLAARYRLGLISNTNDLHIAHVREHFSEALVPFSVTTFSHEAGCVKPDPEIYLRTLDVLGAGPGECLYIDDIAAYVSAAAALGIRGVQYRSTGELRSDFAGYGVAI